ncbi:MAG: MATE family efflux transporter [Bacteroidota bacterium]|nr:MATE family efflux transporter [Bacteroidota bacterium]
MTPYTANINYKALIGIALPIIIGSIAQSTIYISDTIFVARLGETQLAAVGIGGILFYLLTTIGASFSVGFQILLTHFRGERGHTFHLTRSVGIYMVLAGGILAATLYTFSGPITSLLISNNDLYKYTKSYLENIALAVFFSFLYFYLSGFYSGLGKTKVLLFSSFMMAATNILCSYLLVFGNGGFKAYGISGAAMSSSIAEFVGFAVLLVSILYNWKGEKPWIDAQVKYKRNYVQMFNKFTLPLVFKQFVETIGWLLFFIIMERIGERELAVSNVIKSIYAFVTLPAIALASALHTLVGGLKAENRIAEISPVIHRTAVLSLLVTIMAGLLTYIFPNEVILLMTGNTDILPDFKDSMLSIMGVYICFSLYSIYYNGVIGFGALAFSLKLESIAIVIYVIAAFIIAFEFELGLSAIWVAEIIYWVILGLFSIRFIVTHIYKKGNEYKRFVQMSDD